MGIKNRNFSSFYSFLLCFYSRSVKKSIILFFMAYFPILSPYKQINWYWIIGRLINTSLVLQVLFFEFAVQEDCHEHKSSCDCCYHSERVGERYKKESFVFVMLIGPHSHAFSQRKESIPWLFVNYFELIDSFFHWGLR